MSSSNYEVIKDAITNKKNIKADYHNYPRIMTPHVLGHKNGKEQCLLYQFDGQSSSATIFPDNDPKNWRCVFINELKNVSAVEGKLHTCTKHTQQQTCVYDVD